MSRSRRLTPIRGITTAASEAEDKARWHRAHRHAEKTALQRDGADYIESNKNVRMTTWNMSKDGKHYFDAAQSPENMRK